jgi:hypothetical protein
MSDSREIYFDALGSPLHFDPHPASEIELVDNSRSDCVLPARGSRNDIVPASGNSRSDRVTAGGNIHTITPVVSPGGDSNTPQVLRSGSNTITGIADGMGSHLEGLFPGFGFDRGALQGISTMCGYFCTMMEHFTAMAGPDNDPGMQVFRLGTYSFFPTVAIFAAGGVAYLVSPSRDRLAVIILTALLGGLWVIYMIASWRLGHYHGLDTDYPGLRSAWPYGLVVLFLFSIIAANIYIFWIM